MLSRHRRLGVVVPCRDEAPGIRRCLLALRAQDPPVDRIVVVDNGSTDDTVRLAAPLADEVLVVEGGTVAALRNRGAERLADVDLVGFVDADCEVQPGWSGAAVAGLADADLVGSRTLAPPGSSWVAARWAAIERRRSRDDALLWSQHLVLRRETWQALGGFREDLTSGEDSDLSLRVRARGGRVAVTPGMVVVHHGFPRTVGEFWRRERWHTAAPGWYHRMSGSSRRLVTGSLAWSAAGALTLAIAVAGRPAPLLIWLGSTLAALPLLGRVVGGTARHAVADGVLTTLWDLVRAGRLLGAVASGDVAGMTSAPAFEVVLVSYRSAALIRDLLAILPSSQPVALVDNARGVDGLAELAHRRPRCRYVDTGGGAGYARAANLGVRTSSFRYVVLVNPDSRPDPAILAELVRDVADDPTCASSAALNVGPDGRGELGAAGWEPSPVRALVHAVGAHKVFPRLGLFARPAVGEHLDVDWTTGACLAVRRELFLALGGFDERYHVYSEDVAFGHTVRSHGLHQVLRTDLPVPHAGGGSGAPSLEMMRLRGASLARYAMAHQSAGTARTIAGTVALGYLVRAAQQAIQGHRGRAREHWAYAQGALTGRAWVAGTEVTRG